MKELLYLEIPTPDVLSVCTWLQQQFTPEVGDKQITPDGFNVILPVTRSGAERQLSVFVWSLQRTTYLKMFRVGESLGSVERVMFNQLESELRQQFPYVYSEPPEIDLSQQSIFEALAPQYPLTVKYFQKMPNGEADLQRAYWWERRWRQGVLNPQHPQQVIFADQDAQFEPLDPQDLDCSTYDLIYIGGALGVIHAAVMARLGYRVLLMERLAFGRMNREWNISRSELQSLVDLNLFSRAEVETFVAREYRDGFHKFFDANNPPIAKSPVLHTPTVLNVALDTEKLLHLCGEKLKLAGGEIWDETEFTQVRVSSDHVIVKARHLLTQTQKVAMGRLLVDAMGTASPIAWQLNGGRAFDSVCPTVGAVIERGFEPGVWDSDYGDVLNSHGDISRGRQLIWELFPGAGEELTVYLFHYHQVNPENPGSLLEMYEDFFTILPEYRRCDLDTLVWRKATFGYIPGHFSVHGGDRTTAYDRLISIGDAASLQSPLVFTGFGSLVRNLSRLTDLLDTALKHDLLTAKHLNQIRAYQSNVAVTWLFSKGMMVPTGRHFPPQKINSILNTFFGILAAESTEVADAFIKDRVDWWTFTRLALKAARTNPQLLIWILDFVTPGEIVRWVLSYLNFTVSAFMSWIFAWLPSFADWVQPTLEPRFPQAWLWLLSRSYAITDGMGRPQIPHHKKLNQAVVPES
ncbi:MAG: NAD(P)/FAD-dependent oxidoreductase [Microcoleaceae cyanobacterium]